MRPALPRLARRALILGSPLALAGCGLTDYWFGSNKPPIPGKRLPVLTEQHGLVADADAPPVALPAVTDAAAWPQPGNTPAHAGGNMALAAHPGLAWQANIGAGTGYRQRITATPVVADGRVFTMDADAVVHGFSTKDGSLLWRASTRSQGDRSSNVGGGIAVVGGTVYATTGRGDAVAFDAASGKRVWAARLRGAARSGPTVIEDRLFVPLLGDALVALARKDGKELWSHQAGRVDFGSLGAPAPAYADGVLVAGFGSGDLLALRGVSGIVLWGDSLASAGGRGAIAELSAVRGMPAILDGRVYAVSLGGSAVADDLRAGRRLWSRDITSAESPWAAGNYVFFATQDARVAAVSADAGRVAWVTQLQAFSDPKNKKHPILWHGPVLAGGRILVAGEHGKAAWLDPAKGTVLGEMDIPGGGAAVAPVVAGGTLYIVTLGGAIVAYR
ncbi:MAG: PQQ-binding-like beta-propeller repeat protein [Rhodospirillales bacterium]|nr:PQQ-binding-like beta-propeller repeat protein [Rhodospirillales bacterium]